jgi:hypothetical protein
VELRELFEVFRGWHPSVTPQLLLAMIHRAASTDAGDEPAEKPDWNARTGRLCYSGQLVKEFRRPAPNQRRVLSEFQRLQWPDEIANPFLHDRISVDVAVETLRNTTEALNDDHLAEVTLRFGTRDNYHWVYWKVVGEAAPSAPSCSAGQPGDIDPRLRLGDVACVSVTEVW